MICKDESIEKVYNSKRRVYEILKDNAESLVIGTVGAFTVGASMKYLGYKLTTNPIIFGALVTPVIDLFEFTISDRRGNLEKTLQNDVGTFLGQSLGWATAYLL